jgi:hypothetical protein
MVGIGFLKFAAQRQIMANIVIQEGKLPYKKFKGETWV